jgi:hypothetical protein
MGEADVHLLLTSQFVLSLPFVNNVRNYLNVRSGPVTPPKINIV